MWLRRRLWNWKSLLVTLLVVVALTSLLVLSSRLDNQWLSYSSFLRRSSMLSGTGNNSQTFFRSNTSFNVQTPLIVKPECGDIHNVSYKSCPECFRPRVPSFTDLLLGTKILNETVIVNSQEVFRQRPEVVQNLVSDYILAPALACPYLLALQLSITSRRLERDVVRQTWASVAKHQQWPHRRMNANVKVIFVLGREQLAESTVTSAEARNIQDQAGGQWRDLQAEAAQHGDILYLNVQDGYNNLTLKMLSSLKWVKDNCPCVMFVLKVDYDTFVNVPLLVDTLLYFEDHFEFSILGYVYDKKSPVGRRGKWAVPASAYPLDFYPFYASGCWYVLSNKALSNVIEAAPRVPIFSVEDVFITGVMRKVIGCDLFSLPTLFTQFLQPAYDPCLMFHDDQMTWTSADEQLLTKTWQIFESNGSSCVP